jgi:SAM-dependent methyltransferase
MAAEGADLAGEARLMDALLPPRSRVLDAGCGTGRVAAALHSRGHTVVGVDADAELISAARQDYPGPTFVVGDLSTLDLDAVGIPGRFAGAILAGNVMTYVAPNSEVSVLRRTALHVMLGGVVIVGFGLNRGYSIAQFDSDATEAGLDLEHRFATWDLRPFHSDSDFAVSVFRIPEQSV